MTRPDAVSRVAKALHVPPTPLKNAVAQAIPELRVHRAAESREVAAFESQPPSVATDGVAQMVEHPAPSTWGAFLPGMVLYPPFWTKGQLLNVRNMGDDYVLTVLGEEFDPRYPERALRLDYALCQDFISHWYQRESHDPRAR